MDYIQQWQQKLNKESSEGNLRSLVDQGIYSIAPEILALNIEQIDKHQGFDDKPMVNNIRIRSGKRKGELAYKGVYSDATAEFAQGANTSKSAGKPYNFNWYGDFLGNFALKAVGKGFATYSTGTGSDSKKEFFEGYSNMFGLNSKNTATIESEVEYYVLSKVLSRVYG